MNIFKKILPIFIIIALSYFTIKPLLIAGFFPFHDDTQVQRIYEMKKSISDGMFPVRWVADLGYGYGYPIYNFYAPLVYYIGSFLNLTNFDSLASAKIILGLGIILSGITMYLFAREFWGTSGGFISGILYLYTPYHAVDIFVRGDFSEIWAYAFIPLIFLAVHKIYSPQKPDAATKSYLKRLNKSWGWITIGSLSYASLILSHNLTAMMTTPFIIIYSIILYIKSSKQSLLLTSYLLLLTIGVLISAFYWFPALAEMKYTNVLSQIGGGADFKDHFVCPLQLWDSPWGYGGSTPGCADGLSLKIGKLHIILTFFSVLTLYITRKKQNHLKISIYFFWAALLISIFLMLNFSKPIWDMIPQMAFFQYPWRFLIIASIAVSFLGGSTIVFIKHLIKNKSRRIFEILLTAIIILIIIFINKKLFTPQTNFYIQSKDFTNKLNLEWKTSKISDEYMPKNFSKPKIPADIPGVKLSTDDKIIKINILQEKTDYLSAKISTPQNSSLKINIAYFPAWHVFIDNTEINYKILSNGLSIKIPSGDHFLTVKFQQTFIERLADWLSIAGIIALFAGIIIQLKSKTYGQKTT